MEELRNDYMKEHPDAQDPFGFLIAFGLEGIKDLLIKSKGRKIIFEYKPDEGDDVIEYRFE